MMADVSKQAGTDVVCWDGETRKMTVEARSNNGTSFGSNIGHFIYIDGNRVEVWTRLLRGVMYAIPPDVAYARYWHWAEEDLLPGRIEKDAP